MWYHRVYCRQKLFLGAESDPDSSKQEGGVRKRWGGWNINETGVKEKYWADVVVQMQNAWAHVSVSGEAQKKAGAANEQGDNAKLEATEGEQQRGAEMCCERLLTSHTKDHEMQRNQSRNDLRKRFFFMSERKQLLSGRNGNNLLF